MNSAELVPPIEWPGAAQIGARLDHDIGSTDNDQMLHDPRRYAPAAARNREPIFGVLRRHLPKHGLVLEVASGSGEHITHFAQASNPGLVFQPSDPDPGARASIDAWVAALGLTNVRRAIALDSAAAEWPVATADAVVCINMIHISPWLTTIDLVRRAARVLTAGGILYIYGPFRRDGRNTRHRAMNPSITTFDTRMPSGVCVSLKLSLHWPTRPVLVRR